MRGASYKRVLLGLLLVSALMACREVGHVRVYSEGDDIYFDPQGAESSESVVIHSLGVAKDNCDHDCVLWQISEAMDSRPDTESTVSGPIRYGEVPEGFKVHEATSEIPTGRYSVSMSVGYHSVQGDGERSKILYERFYVERTAAGLLRVESESE